jgi:hypothetical protein
MTSSIKTAKTSDFTAAIYAYGLNYFNDNWREQAISYLRFRTSGRRFKQRRT